MAGYLSVKIKRKDLEEVYDDFSDFSLSSPARKIRRLNAELPPIMEEDEPGIPINIDLIFPEGYQTFTDLMTGGLPVFAENEERALVLYNPMNAQLLKSPSSPNFTIMVNSELKPLSCRSVLISLVGLDGCPNSIREEQYDFNGFIKHVLFSVRLKGQGQ